MKRQWWIAGVLVIIGMVAGIWGCTHSAKTVKIGVSFGVGAAVRWEQEQVYMEARAQELGAQIEVRLNKTEEPKTQLEDCKEMIDGGISVLILTARDVNNVDEILEYAGKKNVPVIAYSRAIPDERISLLVGYDSDRIGQKQGQFLTDFVYEGNYILLRGDPGDVNAALLYEGARRYIDAEENKIHILADEAVEGWSPDKAGEIVKKVLLANNNQVDAILAPNDKLAGACAQALEEVGVTKHVVITGMDAELDAVKRIVAGTQDMTLYMDLRVLSNTAVEEAIHMAKEETVNVNTEFRVGSGATIPANMITGQVITKENIQKTLIDTGYYTKDQIYGNQPIS